MGHGTPPRLYAPLKQALAALGYSLIVPALPTMGANATGIGWDSDFKALLDSAELLFSQGKGYHTSWTLVRWNTSMCSNAQ